MARSAAVQRQLGWLYILSLGIISIFSDSRQPNYLNIYPTDIRQICRVGRALDS